MHWEGHLTSDSSVYSLPQLLLTQKNVTVSPKWRTPRTDSPGPPNVGLKLGAVSLGFSLSLPFFILFLHFVSRFQTRNIPPGDYMSITCWNVERSLMFSLEVFFFFGYLSVRSCPREDASFPLRIGASHIVNHQHQSILIFTSFTHGSPISFANGVVTGIYPLEEQTATVEETKVRESDKYGLITWECLSTHTHTIVFVNLGDIP